MINGSCACQSMQFTLTGSLSPAWHCWCRTCRKCHGTPFATHTVAQQIDFHWHKGETLLQRFESSPGKFRCFCPTCGTHLFILEADHPEIIIVVYGSLDSDQLPMPVGHMFTQHQPTWFCCHDNLPKYSQWPPKQLFDTV
ncbi:MAG: aldehyde-activating protein [Legionellales bacterium]|nr:aldehyde-activating protein [Legionellales bacterium]